MTNFIHVREHPMDERFICVDKICSVQVTRKEPGSDPSVFIVFTGADQLTLAGTEAKQFLEALESRLDIK
jgi:hypothetical protein